jgi:hypothetical protein
MTTTADSYDVVFATETTLRLPRHVRLVLEPPDEEPPEDGGAVYSVEVREPEAAPSSFDRFMEDEYGPPIKVEVVSDLPDPAEPTPEPAGQWMTCDAIAAALSIRPRSARRRAERLGWPKRWSDDSLTEYFVLASDLAEPEPEPADLFEEGPAEGAPTYKVTPHGLEENPVAITKGGLRRILRADGSGLSIYSKFSSPEERAAALSRRARKAHATRRARLGEARRQANLNGGAAA